MYSKPLILSDFDSANFLAIMEFAEVGSKFPQEFAWVQEKPENFDGFTLSTIYDAKNKTTSYYIRIMEHDDFLKAMELHIKEEIIFHWKYLRDNFPHKNYCKEYIEKKLYNTYWVRTLNIDVENLIKTLDI